MELDEGIACADCGTAVELLDSDPGFICPHCHTSQEFRRCRRCFAISLVPNTMEAWSCADCGAENATDASPQATARQYVYDLRIQHGIVPEPRRPGSYGIFSPHHGAPPRAASRLISFEGRQMVLIPCPVCPEETPVDPENTRLACSGCGGRFVFIRCEQCDGIWPLDDQPDAVPCPGCGSTIWPTRAHAVTSRDYALMLTEADISG